MNGTRGPGGCDCVSLEDVHLIYDSRQGEYICTNCARVVEAHALDEGPEWFGAENARCAPPSRDARYVSSEAGTSIRGKKRYLSSLDPDRKLRQWLKEVERCAGTLHLDPDHHGTHVAKGYFADYFEARKLQHRPLRENEKLAAAACSVYFGCKSCGIARTLDEISGHCEVPLPECNEAFKSFKSLLADREYSSKLFTTVVPEDLLLRVLGALTFESHAEKMRVEKEARAIFGAVTFKCIMEGRKPQTVCAAVVLLAMERSRVKTSHAAVAKACAISVVTITKGFKELKKHV